MADEIVKFKGTCKANPEHQNIYDECPNCNKKKLHLQHNENGKVSKVLCKNCHHSFDKIKCKTCSTLIYWQDFSTKEIEEKQKKDKKKKEDAEFFSYVKLFLLAIVVAWIYIIIFSH